MKLVSMKLDKKARADTSATASPTDSGDAPLYPWGLEITLDTEALTKLGLAENLPAAGSDLKLTALVDVTSVTENDTADGGSTCSLRLQITDLALSPPKKSDETIAKGLYGD